MICSLLRRNQFQLGHVCATIFSAKMKREKSGRKTITKQSFEAQAFLMKKSIKSIK